jgi:DNA-directed RNA polymerase subunit E'/Rpb7
MSNKNISGTVSIHSKEGYLVNFKKYNNLVRRKQVISDWKKTYKKNKKYSFTIKPDEKERDVNKKGTICLITEKGSYIDSIDYLTLTERDDFLTKFEREKTFTKYIINIIPKI